MLNPNIRVGLLHYEKKIMIIPQPVNSQISLTVKENESSKDQRMINLQNPISGGSCQILLEIKQGDSAVNLKSIFHGKDILIDED